MSPEQFDTRQINTTLLDIGLPKSLREEHGLTVEPVSFSSEQLLFKPDDVCQTFLVLLSGTIRVELTSKSGRLVTLYKIKAGESCILSTSALLNNERFYARGLTESPVQALAIFEPVFQQAIKCSQNFAHFVLESYAKRMSTIVGLVDRMATRDVASAIAEYLLAKQHQQHTQQQPINVTQQALAMEIGTAREVVSRKLAMLEQQGAIQRKRGQIIILDRQLLQQSVAV